MSRHTSTITFKIIMGQFVYRGWHARHDHFHEEIPDGLRFGETDIKLRLVDGKPELEVPAGQKAELVQTDRRFVEGRGIVDGDFIEARIWANPVSRLSKVFPLTVLFWRLPRSILRLLTLLRRRRQT